MPTILALTLGGSWQPIITTINSFQPDMVLFFATSGKKGSVSLVNGSDKPCIDRENNNKQPNIVVQANLQKDQYEIIEIPQPDDLNDCYKIMVSALEAYTQDKISWRKIADYTGGTKSMSAALTIAALQMSWELALVRGARINLVQVKNGTQMASISNSWEIYCHQQMDITQNLFNQYEFSSAAEILAKLTIRYPLDTVVKQKINQWLNYCRAFEAWDAFNHRQALNLLTPYQAELVPQWIFLKRILCISDGHGYELVEDLILNAERCIADKCFDDATARFYRALELLAQIRLGKLDTPIDTSDVDVHLLPPEIRSSFVKEGQIKIGLIDDYDLLHALGDPLGVLFNERKNEFLSLLSIRNQSILAHGNVPVTKEDVINMKDAILNLVVDFYKIMGYQIDGKQFPKLGNEGIIQR